MLWLDIVTYVSFLIFKMWLIFSSLLLCDDMREQLLFEVIGQYLYSSLPALGQVP